MSFMIEEGRVDLSNIRGMIAHSAGTIEPDDAAYLFATGKSELDFRNILALYLHKNLQPGQITIREWKRHDLAILNEKLEPFVIIEGKVWGHTDATIPTKLNTAKDSIKAALEGDLQKLMDAKEKHPDVQTFATTFLFSVEFNEFSLDETAEKLVKYAPLHKRGIKDQGSLEALVEKGREKLQGLMGKYGETMWIPTWQGEFMGARITSEVCILEPNMAKVRKLVKPTQKKEGKR